LWAALSCSNHVLFLEFKPVPGAFVGWEANLAASLLIVVFGFLFVTVSSRIVGLIGSSANPISGMTIATLMATSAIFLVKGWTSPAFGALAITIGGVVCIAAANAGDTSQDLKTGYIVGSTPRLQQIALMIGVVVSTVAIGLTLNLMNPGLQEFRAAPQAWNLATRPTPASPSSRTCDGLPGAVSRYRPEQGHSHPPQERVHCTERAGLAGAGRRKVPLFARDGPIEVQWISGHRQREGRRAAGPADGHRHQRHSEPQTALGTGSAWAFSWSLPSSCWEFARSHSPWGPIFPSAPLWPSSSAAWCAGWWISCR
jgi:hypothetical protein